MGRIAAAVMLPVFLVGGAVMNASVMLVDVHDADGTHIVVPVPLTLAQAALTFAPDEAKRIQAPELAEYLPHAGRILEELRKAPDGLLVEVEERDEHVRIAKEGDVLRIRVTEGNRTDVDLKLPLRSVQAMLGAYDEERRSFRASDLISALKSAPDGELVHVLDGGDEVQIRMW